MSSRFNKIDFRFFDEHYLADYFELLCIVNIDKSLTKSDLSDRIRDNNNTQNKKSNDLKIEELVEKCFRYFKFRSKFYGNDYPFEFNNDYIEIDINHLTDNQKLYIYLLISTHLEYFSSQISTLTREFESICVEASKRLMPNQARVFHFGTAMKGEDEIFSGNLFSRLNTLAELLGATLKINEDELPPTDTGDGGLDIVGYVPFADSETNKIIYVGQCKCGPSWKDGLDAFGKIDRLMHLTNDPNNLYFIPECFRTSSGEWHQRYLTSTKILIDRKRLLELLNGNVQCFSSTESYKYINRFIMEEEKINA